MQVATETTPTTPQPTERRDERAEKQGLSRLSDGLKTLRLLVASQTAAMQPPPTRRPDDFLEGACSLSEVHQ